MLPIDSVQIPLKTASFQHFCDTQRVMTLMAKKQKGTLTQEDIDYVKATITKNFEQRKEMYKTVDKIMKAVDNFEPQVDTKILSRSKDTPLRYDFTTDIKQSDEMNEMLKNVCIAEYAARNYSDPEILRQVENDTGLNYSACYSMMHEAIESYKAGDPQKITFLYKRLFSQDEEKMKTIQDLISQKETQKACDYLKQSYIAAFSVTPNFPEHLLAKGFEVFSTEFCSKSHSAEIMKFGLGECKCPCCEYPELARTSNKKMETVLRCSCDQKLIDTQNEKLFFIPNQGFVCEAHGQGNEKAKRVVLCW